MRIIYLVFVVASVLTLASCSGSSNSFTNGPSASSNAITSGYATAIGQVDIMTAVRPPDMVVGAAFGDSWMTTETILDPRNGGEGSTFDAGAKVTVEKYMALQFDPEVVNDPQGASINLFGRIRNAMEIFCALGVLLPRGNTGAQGYPSQGVVSIPFTVVIERLLDTDCGLDSSGLSGRTIDLTTTIPAGTTYYDRKLSFVMPGETNPSIMYIRVNANEVNIATAQSNSNGRSRTMVHVNLADRITRMEYVSYPIINFVAISGVSGYRMYLNEADDEGYLLVYDGNTDAQAEGTRYALAGKPATTGASVSLSMTAVDLGDTDTALDFHETCYAATGEIGADGFLCTDTLTSIVGSQITQADAVLTDLFTNLGTAGLYTNFAETSAPPPFTPLNMYTIDFDVL